MPLFDVLLVSHGFQKAYERGYSNALVAHGVQPLLVASDETDFAGLRAEVKTLNLRGSQAPGRSAWRKAVNLLRYHLRLITLALIRRRDTLHVIGLIEPLLWCGVVEGFLFRSRPGKYFLTVHDLLPHDRHTPMVRRLAKLAYQMPHQLVVHTRRMRDELIERFDVPPSKVIVMEHGIEPLGPGAGHPIPALPRGDRPLAILFFGTVAHYKGVDLLLDALNGFEFPFELLVAGRCLDPALTARLREQMEGHPARASLHWRNAYIDDAEVPILFSEADVLVLPYRHIDQSGVLFQALRFGVPVVATRVGAFEDYVTRSIGELCEPSVDSLRAALTRLHKRLSSIDCAHIASFGREFEWAKTVVPVIESYRALKP